MFMRQLMIAALVSAVLACVGCSCCHKRAAGYAPPCGCGPVAGPVAVPAAPGVAVPAAPAPCPNCVGP